MILADQLIAAKLNLVNGSDPAPVINLVNQADGLLAAYSGKLPLQVTSSTTFGQVMVNVAGRLEAYNSGSMTPLCGSVAAADTAPFDPTGYTFRDIVSFIVIIIATSV